VRGVRTGLSINDCLKQIVNDSEHVVAEQFLVILDDFKIGLNTEQAMERFMKRMPMKEVYFFGLSIIIQVKTGGNLAEIIDNLSKVLKNRKSLLLKIKTLSSEAKTSAIIMGSLPLFIMGILSMMSPEYLKPLFDTFSGNMVLTGCAIWMSIGGLIMRSMINFYR
jgi:tight adherence protein B